MAAKMVAVSMVLTASRYGRRGLAGRLMERILAESEDATAFLYATPYGHPLYERLRIRRDWRNFHLHWQFFGRLHQSSGRGRYGTTICPSFWRWTSRCSVPIGRLCCAG